MGAMALAPVRLLGPMRAVDSQSSHTRLTAAAASSYGSSIHTRRPSLLFLLHHRSRLSSSLQFRQQQPVLCSSSSSLPDIAEEGFEHAAAEAKQQTWRRGTSSSSSSSPAGIRKNASKSSDEQETEAAGGDRGGRSSSSSARNEESSRYPTHSSNSRYDSRSMHKAPWEQGPAATRGGAAGRSNSSKETKQQHVPNNRVAVLRDRVEEEGASIDEEGGGGKVAMARIVDKLRSIQNNSPLGDLNPQPRQSLTTNSVFLPRPGQPVFLGVNKGWSTPDHPIPEPATDSIADQQGRRLRFPWEANSVDEEDSDEETTEQKKKVRPPTMAELTIPVDELKRLRGLGLMVRRRLKIGRLGVTPGIIEAIHNAWKNSEIVKVKCEGPPAINMRKTHQALERGTGGLVIWRAGSAAVVYRGKDYVPPSVRGMQEKEEQERKALMSLDPEEGEDAADSSTTQATAVDLSGLEEIKSEAELEEEAELKAMEDVLEGLGPRWVNWTGNRPVPIDGDLLLSPDAVCKRPFRLLPYGVKPKLTDFELTDLRRFARPLPPHFVLGRNRGLSGLAAAIVKLWEKTEVVKIAVKRGVQNTNNELMAEELKALTGGTLLARDKEFITLYRGKDFLPQAVQAALQERDSITKALQEEEERARMRSRSTTLELADAPSENRTTGTLAETLEAKAAWESWQNSEEQRKMVVAARKAKRAHAANRIERRVNLAIQKKERAERELAKVEHFMNPADAPVDREHITEEERYMFRKLGLRMKAYLLVGRRGVFDGVVENMHLHWKHRELVKIIIKGSLGEVEKAAKMLEIESGGILVGIVTTSKGQAIIMYRGKNYQRPSELRPRHLLTKRQALKRSLELQRKASLEKHILTLEKEIEAMKLGLNKLEEEDRIAEGLEIGSESDEGPALESSLDLSELDPVELDEDYDQFAKEDDPSLYKKDQQTKHVKLGPIYKAEPLTKKERLLLRHQALKLSKVAHFHIGKSNVVAGLAKSIRLYLQKHAFVKVSVKGRAKGTPVAEIVQQLEDATGAVLVSTEPSKLIMYRGWPEGEEHPSVAAATENELISPELRSAMRIEDETVDRDDLSYLSEAEARLLRKDKGNDDDEDEDEDDWGVDAWNEEEWEEDEDEDDDVDGQETMQGLDEEILDQWGEEDFSEDEGETDRKEDNELEETLKSERRLHSAGNHDEQSSLLHAQGKDAQDMGSVSEGLRLERALESKGASGVN